MMSLAASKYSVESWPVTSIEEETKRVKANGRCGRVRDVQRVERTARFVGSTMSRGSTVINHTLNKVISVVTNLRQSQECTNS